MTYLHSDVNKKKPWTISFELYALTSKTNNIISFELSETEASFWITYFINESLSNRVKDLVTLTMTFTKKIVILDMVMISNNYNNLNFHNLSLFIALRSWP